MSSKIIPINSTNISSETNPIKQKTKSSNSNVIDKYFFSCRKFSSKHKKNEINIVQGAVDIFDLMDKLKILLSDDAIDAEYRSQLSDYAMVWVMVAKLTVNNSKAARPLDTIKDFAKKGSSPIITTVLKCIYDSNLSKVQLTFFEIDEDNFTSKFNLFEVPIQNIKEIFDKEVKNPSITNRQLTYYPNSEIAIEVGLKTFKTCIPSSEVKWNDVQSDETLSKVVFSGCGQEYVIRCKETVHSIEYEVPKDAYYVVDLSALHKYPVRSKYERYGAIAYFNKNYKPIAIWYVNKHLLSKPGDSVWKHAKAIFRSTLITLMTAREHLSYTHFIISNSFLLSVGQNLSEIHPIRRLLKPHTFGTSSINRRGNELLLPYFGIAAIGFGFTKEGWNDVNYDCLTSFKYELFPDSIKAKGFSDEELARFPLAEDGLDYWKVVRDYIISFLNIFYIKSDEDLLQDKELCAYWNAFKNLQSGISYQLPELSMNNLIDHLTYNIFHVTGGHQLYGSIVEYLIDPYFMPAKLSPTSEVADIQTHILTLALISLTGGNQPMLMSDWSHLYPKSIFKEKHENIVAVLSKFQNNLALLSNTIDERNIKRTTSETLNAFNGFNPRVLESSVSV